MVRMEAIKECSAVIPKTCGGGRGVKNIYSKLNTCFAQEKTK
jgi:hypothetical protein